MARAAVAAGADGVHVEVHSCPEKALSDGPQALLPDQYARLMDELRAARRGHGQDDRRMLRGCPSDATALHRRQLEDEPRRRPRPPSRSPRPSRRASARRGGRPGRALPARDLPPCDRRRPRRLADRPGRPEHALEGRRRVHRATSPGAMLVDAGCTHVILGHSERRHGIGETDAQVNAQAPRRARARS